ncbi:hypothetical protein FRC12_000591 [Ceratobasidium sp. 428]|nr:hypothetical protein FRC12_000591 [Ceratobasidium sp. 428]
MLSRASRALPRRLKPLSFQTFRAVPRLTPLPIYTTRKAPNQLRFNSSFSSSRHEESLGDNDAPTESRKEHAVISTFDLFSVGVGPSSSHTVGPMRAARIFIVDLQELGLLDKTRTLKVTLYGSLAATGKGHMTPQALLMGFEGSDPESIDTGAINSRYDAILQNKTLNLGGVRRIKYDMDKDMLWRWDQVLKTHPNGMRFSAFGEDGELLATNEYFSVGGGFVVNDKTKVDENLFYKGVDKSKVDLARLSQTHGQDAPALSAPSEETNDPEQLILGNFPSQVQPPYLFHDGASLLAMSRKHNKTIAQLVYDNELHYLKPVEIRKKILKIWTVMDECIRTGVSSVEPELPGRLRLRRRAPMLYKRLMRGFYRPALYSGLDNPAIAAPALPMLANPITETGDFGEDAAPSDRPSHPHRFEAFETNEPDDSGAFGKAATRRPARVVGSFEHAILPMPSRKTLFPAMDFLSCYAIAVNEVNAAGGRIVTSPTNGASGVIPAVLKYIVEFISEDPEKDIATFLLTAAAIGEDQLFQRLKEGVKPKLALHAQWPPQGSPHAWEVRNFVVYYISTHMYLPFIHVASPEVITQAAEIGIEHNLGLTCDPIDGLVQVPCIERNSLGAVKAVTAAQLALASDGVHSVTLDEAIEAMRLTAQDMSVKYKETSLSGLATTVKIPLTSPAC